SRRADFSNCFRAARRCRPAVERPIAAGGSDLPADGVVSPRWRQRASCRRTVRCGVRARSVRGLADGPNTAHRFPRRLRCGAEEFQTRACPCGGSDRTAPQRTVTVTGAEVVLLPARSIATAVSVLSPLATFLVFH